MAEVTLSPGALKRLARLQARAEGAIMVAQAAEQAARQAQAALQQTLTEECADEGMTIPQDEQMQVQIDWRSGEVRLVPGAAPNGMVPSTEPAF